MAPGQGLDVAGIAQTILNGIVEHYADVALDVALPGRQIIGAGNPRLVAWDCEQVVVTLSGIGNGAAPGTGDQPRGVGSQISSMGLRHAIYAVQIVRCHPESPDGTTPPDAAEVTAAGLISMRDAGLLSQALVAVATKIGAGGLPPGSRVQPGAVETLGPEGGFSGIEGALALTTGALVS
jgi:hypothetical protein